MSLIELWAGRIDFAGEDITRLRTDQRVRRGIVFMSETSGFPGLTIEENVLIGAQFLSKSRARERIDELYTVFPALAERRRARAGSLSGGQRKMLGRRQSSGRRSAPARDGRAFGGLVAALRQGGDRRCWRDFARSAWRC